MALVVLLSAFNGIESMVEKLYSEFDSDLTIRSLNGKTFNERQIDFKKLSEIEGVGMYSKAVEEVVVLKHEKKSVSAHLVGIEDSFLKMTSMDHHMVDGFPMLYENEKPFGIIGASLLDKLGGFIPKDGYESLIFYLPKRDAKVRPGSNPFVMQSILISGRMNFNREVNSDLVIIPLNLAKELLRYDNAITAVYINAKQGENNDHVKERLQQFVGKDFEVKTNYEKNELIYKTSKTERMIVLFILLFIFILAAFNLVASLTMLFIEKKDNIQTMISYGADKKIIFRIFFYEGLMISFKGIIFGLVAGYAVCFLQIFGQFLTMPNSGGEAFPVNVTLGDGILIVVLVCSLSIVASYLPVRYLIRKNFDKVIF